MRRSVYKADGSTKFGVVTADAGVNQSKEKISEFSNLDGTGSSTTVGSMSTYLWEVISGTGIVIDSPTTSTSSLSGTTITGDHMIQLTVVDTNGNVDKDTITLTIEAPDILLIDSTVPTYLGEGDLVFSNGVPNEVITLGFKMIGGTAPDSMTFSGGIMVGQLSYLKTSTTGSITLDGSGEGISNFNGDGNNFRVDVTITGRSSEYPIPEKDFTLIPIYY